MKHLAILLLLMPLFLNANSKMEAYALYQDNKYEAACLAAEQVVNEYLEDEEFLSIYAFSCLNADQLDKMLVPIAHLKRSSESRANAAYFSVLLMQKNLLIHALADQYELKSIKFPSTQNVLSVVYDLYSSDNSSKKRRRYNYTDPSDPKKSYRLFITKTATSPKMVIEEYYDKILSKRHIYW